MPFYTVKTSVGAGVSTSTLVGSAGQVHKIIRDGLYGIKDGAVTFEVTVASKVELAIGTPTKP